MISEQTVLAHPNSFVHAAPPGKAPSVNVLFDILEGPDKGQQITGYFYMTDKTEAYTAEKLMNCGWDGTDFKKLPGFGSKDPYIVIKHETFEGKERAKVQFVNSATRTAGVKEEDRMNDAQIKGFAARMEAMAKAAKATAGASTPKDATLKGSDGEDVF